MNALPRNTGNGWALSKVHDLLHIPKFITRFGSPLNYNTGFCEHNHKYQAKIPGRKAAKRQETFTKSIAQNIVNTYVIDLFNDMVEQQEDYNDNILYESLSSDEDINDPHDINESVKYATYCFILWDASDARYKVKWNTKSEVLPVLPNGLLRFIARTYELKDNPARYITLFTQYCRNKVLFRCHPDFRGGGPWYDWMMMQYEDPNNPRNVLSCPARLMAVVVDSTDQNKVYQPIIQWAGNRTTADSVLFTEYDFDHRNNDFEMNTFSIHDVMSIERPIFVIDCETDNHNKILVAADPDKWSEMFV